jgi:alpha-galactosidase
MWRSTGDIFDTWESIKDLTHQQASLHPYNGVGCFNDMDMLVVGMYGKGNVGLSGCNDIQYRTHFSIWSFLGSPLMIGCDIRSMTPATKEILTKKELIEINQDIACRQPYLINGIWKDDETLVYGKNLANGDIAIGLFNLKGEKTVARFNLDELGLPHSTGKTLDMTDIWSGNKASTANSTVVWELGPYDCAVFRAKVVDIP